MSVLSLNNCNQVSFSYTYQKLNSKEQKGDFFFLHKGEVKNWTSGIAGSRNSKKKKK